MTRTIFTLCAVACASVLPARAADKHEHHHHDHHAGVTEAVCVIVPTKGNQTEGAITMVQKKGHVLVTGEVRNLKPGEHGFHVHMFGDLRSPDGSSLGGHFDPKGDHKHGGPDAKDRHAGDLGNIKADADGVAKVNIKAEGLDVHSVLGRSLVVHADRDDLKSQPSGNSGPRIGVGVIGVGETKKK